MKKIGLFFIFLFLNSAILSHTLTERKKSLEKRLKSIDSISSVFMNELQGISEDLHTKRSEFESALSLGNNKEIKHKLEIFEKSINFAEHKTSSLMGKKAMELLEKFDNARDPKKNKTESFIAENNKENGNQQKKLSRASIEKISQYFKMAKTEYLFGEKNLRDRNFYFAINLFKRSIRYSLKGIEETGHDLPTDFTVARAWLSASMPRQASDIPVN